MSLTHLTKYALTLKPEAAAAGAWRLMKRTVSGVFISSVKQQECAFLDPDPETTVPAIFASNLDYSVGLELTSTFAALCEHILEHRVNLLGSGWVKVSYGMTTTGFGADQYPPLDNSESIAALHNRLNPGNRERAKSIRELISADYCPIDWQLDFISGHRWREDQISETIKYGHEAGADIKVPWELARLQHLPQLAYAHKMADINSQDKYVKEFQNQALDFIAANPPGWGVNWACTMDVAIRAANMILAFDLFRTQGAVFNGKFTGEFMAAIRAHGHHVAENLEWHPEHRGNHYLANITGLLFIARFLPSSIETDTWLAFGIQELTRECEYQFLDDGANFEASTSYHRLSAEMIAYGTALILGIPEDRSQTVRNIAPSSWPYQPPLRKTSWDRDQNYGPFPPTHFSRLSKMAEFTIQVTKQNGRIVQIGDNDNGRFFKICPVNSINDLDENHLDHRGLVAAINGLIDRPDFAAFATPSFAPETEVVRSLSDGYRLNNIEFAASLQFSPPSFQERPADQVTEINIELPDPVLAEGLSTHAYPDFGLFIWRSDRLFLSVRCGPVGQNGRGGHAHNDQLAIELQIDGEDWIADPGSFVYTADAKCRDAYRSAFAHTTPRFGKGEPSSLGLGMFRLEDNADAKCLRFDENGFHGTHNAFGDTVFRQISFSDGRIILLDGFGGNIPGDTQPQVLSAKSPDELRQIFNLTLPFSRGYGIQGGET